MTNTQLPKEETVSSLIDDLCECVFNDRLYGTGTPARGVPHDADPEVSRLKQAILAAGSAQLQSLQAENLRLREALEKSAGVWVNFADQPPLNDGTFLIRKDGAGRSICVITKNTIPFWIERNYEWLDETALTETVTSKTE